MEWATIKITNIQEFHVNAWQKRIIKQMACEHLGNEVVITRSYHEFTITNHIKVT